MKIHRVLFFCCVLALCGGDTGLVSARLNIYTGPQGDTGSVTCYLSLTGSKKFFCKNECKGEDILIRTDDVRAESGRYSIGYKNESSGRGILTVAITNMTKSDSGKYTCGLGKDLVPDLHSSFELRVLDAPLVDGAPGFTRTDFEGETITIGCNDMVSGQRKFLCKDKCKKEEDIIIETDQNKAQSGRYSLEYKQGSVFELSVTITRATKSDSGWYRCGYGRALSPESQSRFVFAVMDAPATSTWTRQPCSTSAPSSSTQADEQSSTSSSGSLSAPSVFPETTDECSGHTDVSHLVFLVSLVGCVFVIVVLLALVLLQEFKYRALRNTKGVTDENQPPVLALEDSVHQSLDPASRDQDRAFSTPNTHNETV